MNQLAAVPNLGLPSDAQFLSWLDERGLTKDVVKVVRNLRRYFPDDEIRLEQVEDPESLNEVLVVVRPEAVTDPRLDGAVDTMLRFDEEWLLKQDMRLLLRVGVYMS